MSASHVHTEDTSSGRIHKRTRDGARLLVDERCNLDDAGAFRVLTGPEFMKAATEDRDRLCQHCYPVGEPVVLDEPQGA